MTDYPEKTCSIDRLLLHPRLVELAAAGRKTEQRRNGVYGYPGERFEAGGVLFEITALERSTLGAMGDAGAQAEGFESMEGYKQLILRMHPGMQWNDDSPVWLHRFAKVAGE